jgi:uncharacterized membrane protein YphA (DoxX/SURF4 family)
MKNSAVLMWALVALRVVIGWHFLYEGVSKLLEPNWTSAGFLAESNWLLSDLFHWIAETPAVLRVVDLLNIWGLALIGLALILGAATRLASFGGLALLLLYYVANPPLVGMGSPVAEGSYLLVNKNVVEMMALLVLALVPTGEFLGLDHLLQFIRNRKPRSDAPGEARWDAPSSLQRRALIRSFATVPVLGGFVYEVLKKQGYDNFEEKHLMSAAEADSVTSATVKTFNFASLKDLKGQIPKGKLMDLELSRLILGGNLVGGWAHARDLIYVSKLVKAYHTDEKVFATFQLAERCGINTFLTNPQLCRVINKYWRTRGGKIQFISDCGYGQDAIKGIDLSIEGGAHACYVQGEISDRCVREGRPEKIAEAVEYARKQNVPAGIGAHSLKTVQECVRLGMKPDFWVKTLHTCDYWSAQPEEEHDNIWCTNPNEVIEFMNDLEEPWIAFKTLAAGAIHPNEGFKYAFENGADFICVGMYDFQVVEDSNIALDALASDMSRVRPWRG